MNDAELRVRLDAVTAAEGRLLQTLASLAEDDLSAPSLCEGWTRGHVLAHVALNAHSLVNLMDWARTGTVTPQYASWEERDADIERFSERTKDEHVAALQAAGAAFAEAALAVPLERWDVPVHGIGGSPQPAGTFLFGRLREVEIHHVDLAAGYGAADWDAAFVRRVLEEVPERLGSGVSTPFTVEAQDLGLSFQVGDAAPSVHVKGAGHAVLAWLLGRSDGSDLEGTGDLPAVPSWG